MRHVATQAGVEHFKLPLHSPIIKHPRVSQFFTAQDQSLNFDQAKEALRSPKHIDFRRKATEINARYGAATFETRDLIGDTSQYGTEDSIMQRIRASPATSKFIAAEKGLAGNQLSVLNFVHDRAGKDLLVTVQMPYTMSSGELRDTLDKRGLEFRSIDPNTNELVFFSEKGDKLAEIKQLANDFAGGKVTISRGSGEFVGSDESREEARNVYRRILARSPRYGFNGEGFGYSDHRISATVQDEESSLNRVIRLSADSKSFTYLGSVADKYNGNR